MFKIRHVLKYHVELESMVYVIYNVFFNKISLPPNQINISIAMFSKWKPKIQQHCATDTQSFDLPLSVEMYCICYRSFLFRTWERNGIFLHFPIQIKPVLFLDWMGEVFHHSWLCSNHMINQISAKDERFWNTFPVQSLLSKRLYRAQGYMGQWGSFIKGSFFLGRCIVQFLMSISAWRVAFYLLVCLNPWLLMVMWVARGFYLHFKDLLLFTENIPWFRVTSMWVQRCTGWSNPCFQNKSIKGLVN